MEDLWRFIFVQVSGDLQGQKVELSSVHGVRVLSWGRLVLLCLVAAERLAASTLSPLSVREGDLLIRAKQAIPPLAKQVKGCLLQSERESNFKHLVS